MPGWYRMRRAAPRKVVPALGIELEDLPLTRRLLYQLSYAAKARAS